MKYFLLPITCFFLLLNCSSDTPYEKPQQANFVSLKDSLLTLPISMDSIHYDFVAYDKNQIQQKSALKHFFRQLQKLEEGEIRQVRIAHIGDSHIQADFLPGKMRYLLQSQFGNAGRGLVFPYQQAGTHSPKDFKSQSKASFEAKRSAFKKEGPSIGLSGMSIKSTADHFDLSFFFKERYGQVEKFDRLSIFREPSNLDLSLRLKSAKIETTPLPSADPYQIIFQLPQAVTAATFSAKNQNSTSTNMTIHGWLLENTSQAGILYNMMGVNGTTYFHFNRCEYFMPELQALAPDLIIISLGTNEALTRDFTQAALRREVDKFLAQLQESCPQSSILITTLPEAWQNRKVPSVHIEPARQVLKSAANDFQTGLWDLHQVMGGRGSMQHWVNAQLGYVDYIHFTEMGYELQADLLYTALMEAYHEYR